MSYESRFAKMSSREFVDHLEAHGLVPTSQEKYSKPVGMHALESGITRSILEMTGQRFGDPSTGESSAK